MTVIGDLS